MGIKFDLLPEHVQKQIRGENPKPKRNKYGSTRVQVDGFWFDSKHESEVYLRLADMHRKGEILWFTRQSEFGLPGSISYVADFIVAYRGTVADVEVWDAKSSETKKNRTYINKKKQMKAIYGIEIKEV